MIYSQGVGASSESTIPAPPGGMETDYPTEPWRQYFNEFQRRAGRVPPDAFDRAALLYEAAHDAYQTTTNQLTASGVDGERALMIGRMFGAVVKEWVDGGNSDVEQLETSLQASYAKLLSAH